MFSLDYKGGISVFKSGPLKMFITSHGIHFFDTWDGYKEFLIPWDNLVNVSYEEEDKKGGLKDLSNAMLIGSMSNPRSTIGGALVTGMFHGVVGGSIKSLVIRYKLSQDDYLYDVVFNTDKNEKIKNKILEDRQKYKAKIANQSGEIESRRLLSSSVERGTEKTLGNFIKEKWLLISVSCVIFVLLLNLDGSKNQENLKDDWSSQQQNYTEVIQNSQMEDSEVYNDETPQSNMVNVLVNSEDLEDDDSGPDFFAVTNVSRNDSLNIRVMPNSEATKVGEVPYNGGGLRNLGCNGVSFSQWLEMSERERIEAGNKRWCKIEYKGVSGWVHGKFLKEDTVSQEKGAVSGGQNTNVVEIKSIPKKTGFLTKETKARSDIKSENGVSVGIKNGTEIVITGISNDNEWYEIESSPLKGKFYVPVGNVGTFGN